MHCSWQRDQFEISTDPHRIDLVLVHGFLTGSYWAKGIPLETVKQSIQGSICFGIYDRGNGQQVGFARVITDRATFAYLADVFVVDAFRGKGLSMWIMACIKSHPQLRGAAAVATGYRRCSRPLRAVRVQRPENPGKVDGNS